MKIERYKCENCGKETEDYYSEIGWLHAEGKIILTMGRRKSDRSYPIDVLLDGDSDFCSVNCFVEYLAKKKEEREIKEEIRREKH